MSIEEQKTFIQRQIMELAIDIQTRGSDNYIVGYDVSEDGERLFVYLMGRTAPFMSFEDGLDWLLDFDRHYDEKAVNDCMTSLACVLSDLENKA